MKGIWPLYCCCIVGVISLVNSKSFWDSPDDRIDKVRNDIDTSLKSVRREKLRKKVVFRDESSQDKMSPKFMTKLYENVSRDSENNLLIYPYGAKVVRSFYEIDEFHNYLFVFNVSDLEETESLIEAELHFHWKKKAHPSFEPRSIIVVRVYQVLNGANFDDPDLGLLSIQHIESSPGWKIINVKQAVVSWLSGAPTLGLLVTTTTISGEPVEVEFSRKHDLRPILVLYNDELTANVDITFEGNDLDLQEKRLKRSPGEQVPSYMEDSLKSLPQRFSRRKRPGLKRKQSIVKNEKFTTSAENRRRGPKRGPVNRPRRSMDKESRCEKQSLFVSFRDLGFQSVVAPLGYEAYRCSGPCKIASLNLESEISNNYDVIQNLIQKMNLTRDEDIDTRSCCVPTSLTKLPILYYDENWQSFVLKSFSNMIVTECGCQ